MILLRLFYEFFKTGLFSVGGGMATIPFLQHMGEGHRLVHQPGAHHHDRRL
ncbi:MAG: chromate transporter [Flavonifractor plautii]